MCSGCWCCMRTQKVLNFINALIISTIQLLLLKQRKKKEFLCVSARLNLWHFLFGPQRARASFRYNLFSQKNIFMFIYAFLFPTKIVVSLFSAELLPVRSTQIAIENKITVNRVIYWIWRPRRKILWMKSLSLYIFPMKLFSFFYSIINITVINAIQ